MAISPTTSLFVAQRPSTDPSTLREHGEVLGVTRGGWENVLCCSTKAAISLKRVKIEENLLPRAPKLFGYRLLSQERVKLRTSNLAGTFTGSIREKGAWACPHF